MSRTGMSRVSLFVSSIVLLASVGGVYASWKYASLPPNTQTNLPLSITQFDYTPPMPDGEITLLQRLYDILNQIYTTDEIQDARKYLLEETIKVAWDPGAPPYVGSMDKDYAVQLDNLSSLKIRI